MALKELTALTELTTLTDLGWLHTKLGGVDYRMRPQVLFDLYNLQTAGNEANRTVTKSEVGLGNVTDDAQLTIANDLSDVADAPTARTNLSVDSSTEVTAKVDAHADLATGNPHSVTKSEVGLGNVPNYIASSTITDTSTSKFATINAVAQVNTKITNIEPNVIPAGAIMLWSGTYASIPAGWAALDGLEGRLDMRGYFPRGGDGQTVGDVGGADTNTHTHPVTVSGHTLTLDEMPMHQHGSAWGTKSKTPPHGAVTPKHTIRGSFDSTTDDREYLTGEPVKQNSSGDDTLHKYNITDTTLCDPHGHNASTSVNAAPAENNVPSYRTLIYIIKL